MNDTLKIAEAIARKAHEGQSRYDGVTPFISHPEAVAGMIRASCPEANAAEAANPTLDEFDRPDEEVAWLHDSLEDSNLTAADLLKAGISERVVNAVVAITQLDGESYPDYHRRLAKDPLAASVKIADMCHNLSDKPTLKSTRKYSYLLAHLALGTPLPETYEGLE